MDLPKHIGILLAIVAIALSQQSLMAQKSTNKTDNPKYNKTTSNGQAKEKGSVYKDEYQQKALETYKSMKNGFISDENYNPDNVITHEIAQKITADNSFKEQFIKRMNQVKNQELKLYNLGYLIYHHPELVENL